MFRRFAQRSLSRLVVQPYFRQTRGMTLGTRVAVIDDWSLVLLVRHTYAPGWMLPGGGVERGETLSDAALRELSEEAGIIAGEDLRLFGVYLNDQQFPGDHVACFVLRRFRQEAFVANREIAEIGFFAVESLPPDTSPGTRRRIAEIFTGARVSSHW